MFCFWRIDFCSRHIFHLGTVLFWVKLFNCLEFRSLSVFFSVGGAIVLVFGFCYVTASRYIWGSPSSKLHHLYFGYCWYYCGCCLHFWGGVTDALLLLVSLWLLVLLLRHSNGSCLTHVWGHLGQKFHWSGGGMGRMWREPGTWGTISAVACYLVVPGATEFEM